MVNTMAKRWWFWSLLVLAVAGLTLAVALQPWGAAAQQQRPIFSDRLEQRCQWRPKRGYHSLPNHHGDRGRQF